MKIFCLLVVSCSVLAAEIPTKSGAAINHRILEETVGGAGDSRCDYPMWPPRVNPCFECVAVPNSGFWGACTFKQEKECTTMFVGLQYNVECIGQSSACGGNLEYWNDVDCSIPSTVSSALCVRSYRNDYQGGDADFVNCPAP